MKRPRRRGGGRQGGREERPAGVPAKARWSPVAESGKDVEEEGMVSASVPTVAEGQAPCVSEPTAGWSNMVVTVDHHRGGFAGAVEEA